jgi:SAM-dependent methyltransferase
MTECVGPVGMVFAGERPRPPEPAETEFDSYASDYSAGMDNPMKRLIGEAADDFVRVKLRWLLRAFPALMSVDASYRVLDYGCGTGTLLRLMQQVGVRAALAGCDISGGMLAEAMRCWPFGLPQPELRQQDGAAAPFPDAHFDLAVISAVLHHVAPAERAAVYEALRCSLRPGGSLVVFEHNPWNPVTRYVVAHTPIDSNAVLLRPGEVRTGLQAAGFAGVCTGYLMFFPPRLHLLGACERALGWLPLGAQYAVTARCVPG